MTSKASTNRTFMKTGSKMMPKWMPKSVVFNAFSKKAKTLQTLCFPISKLQSKSAPCQSEVLVLKKGFDAKKCNLENYAPPHPSHILEK